MWLVTKRSEKSQAQVLTVLRRQSAPVSAYDVLGESRATNAKIAPPAVYGALTALIEQGRVHRLECLNAFVACQRDPDRYASVLSICDDCGTVEESVAPDLLKELSSIVSRSGFAPLSHVIEVHGVCAVWGAGTQPREASARRTAIGPRHRCFQRPEYDH